MQCGYREAADELKQYRSCLSARSFWEFDDVYIAPLHGFEHVRDYYESASPARHLHQGQWPLLIIQSEDDPLVPATGFPELASMPSNVQVKRFRQGGHVGFLNWVNGRLESQLPGLITRGLQLAVGL
jgi:predicted alpha/beta-fold hydrolase